MSDTIICPSCSFEIEVTEVLSAQLRSQLQKEFEADIRKKESAIAEREKDVVRAKEEVAKAKDEINSLVEERLGKERKQLSDEALTKAREQVTLELQDKDQQLSEANTKLKAAQDAELVLRKERRELEEQKQTLELTLNRRLDEERTKIRDAAKKEAVEERQLKEAEKDKLINDLRTQIEDLRRKSEQGSQQLQGEVLEDALEELLRQHFPFDEERTDLLESDVAFVTPAAEIPHGPAVGFPRVPVADRHREEFNEPPTRWIRKRSMGTISWRMPGQFQQLEITPCDLG